MMLTVLSYVLLAIGTILAVLMAAAWRANLPELRIVAHAAFLTSGLTLPEDQRYLAVLFVLSAGFFVLSATTCIRLYDNWIDFKGTIPGIISLSFCAVGLWLTWNPL